LVWRPFAIAADRIAYASGLVFDDVPGEIEHLDLVEILALVANSVGVASSVPTWPR
jgi:hypothetical protein